MDRPPQTTVLSRRTFLTTTSAALVGVALGGLAPQSAAAQRQPQRGGVLQFGSRLDTAGLDSHRHNQLHTGHPTAVMYTSLTDIDYQGNIVPGVAESWEPTQDLTAWVFRLRKGVLFHNGREVDAEAVKLNILRLKDPAIGSDFHRGAVDTIASVDVLDKYTVRLNATMPDASLPSSVMHYPTNLQAPDNFDNAAEHPIGTGPFKFVSWTRFNETRLIRFENYWETDAEGHSLPYLDEIVGKPKREDSVRLTALRTGQVQLIDAIAYADVERFKKSYADKYNIWPWHAGGVALVFNFRRGPLQDKRPRTAAAHAIDRQAIHNSVFYGQGDMLDQLYPHGDPWHLESRSLEYDPDKAKALLKQARAVGTPLKIVCSAIIAYNREIGQIVQEQWNSVGFKVDLQPLDTVPFVNARKQGEFDGLVQGHTARFDPDDFFGRNLYSKGELTQALSGWQNERYDRLIEEAKKTLDPARRKELYTEGWSIVNDELPYFFLHQVTQTSAAVKELKGYQPNVVGALTYRGGGFRTAYIET
jgi:peptide/nickel transport system substrate-binding protein